jgi:hypothetical protein
VFLERLHSRKARVGQSLDQSRASRRFEAETTATAPPGADETSRTPPQRPMPRPAPAAKPQESMDDFASRLMRAKRRAMEERDKKKDL